MISVMYEDDKMSVRFSYVGRPVYASITQEGHVQVSNGWWSEYPIQYDDGRMGWDFPERVPDYAKGLALKAFAALMAGAKEKTKSNITVTQRA